MPYKMSKFSKISDISELLKNKIAIVLYYMPVSKLFCLNSI